MEPSSLPFCLRRGLFIATGGILLVNSDKKYAKSAARDQWSLDSLYLQELPFVMGRSGN